MNSYRHLVALDLSSYGSALAIINQFCDDEDVKVFEVSPLGTAALLLLVTREAMAAHVLKNQILSHWGQSILSHTLIQDTHEDLFKTYLSQTSVPTQKNLIIFESSSVSEALFVANDLLKNNIPVIDLRVIRTYPSNSIVTATSEKVESLVPSLQKHQNLKMTLIENTQTTLKKYFEIIQ